MPSVLQGPDRLVRPVCTGCLRGEISTQQVAHMITRQCDPGEVLGVLCEYVGAVEDERQVAFFRFDGESWRLAASGPLPAGAAAVLAGLDPAPLSLAMFEDGAGGGGREESPCESGWSRHLHSGAGELMGMLVGVADGPMLPYGVHAARIESACRLAVLAIEQSNLISELSFNTGSEAAAGPPCGSFDAEAVTQQVNRMIARQCPPEEILAALCVQMGRSRAERQVAFFRLDGNLWELAARGELAPSAEAALARLDPRNISDALLIPSAASAGRRECVFGDGWARHLYSGAGELLGLLVGFADGPMLPCGGYATRIETVCDLAALAIEHNHLITELRFKADHDALTALFNRSSYERILASMLRRNQAAGCGIALLYINLDRFRMVNDVMGPAIGNRLLQGVGRRIQQSLRRQDMLARVGGDEFTIVLPDSGREDAAALAGRLLEMLKQPFEIEGHELFASASIGIGCAGTGSTPESLEREAYVALYQAKQAGKGRFLHFLPSMAAALPERLEMEKRLRTALSRRELRLDYQPQIDLTSGQVRGAEALLRWYPQGLGKVSPAVFVPVLEETGLILEVGRWVLKEACLQGKAWKTGTGLPLRMGVNVSAAQFMEPDFARDVAAVLAETGFPPGMLELELTESLFVGDFAAAARAFEGLRKTGIQLALDDFGTGQSSLSYLNRLPFHRLKIDQSFVRPAGSAEGCPPLLQTIVQMAGNLGLETIAEGVETQYQADLLRSLGCTEAQGFLFAPGLPPDDFVEFLRSR